MAKKGLDFKRKEVINIADGRKLGMVLDIEADLESGKILSIIVPGENKALSFLTKGNEIVIPWENIKQIGDETILVEI